MSGASFNDPLEIIDDPAELIANRAASNAQFSADSSFVELEGTEPPSSTSSPRPLPPGFSSRPGNNGHDDLPSSRTSSSLTSPHAGTSMAHRNQRSRVWNPPPRPWEKEMREKAASAVAAMNTPQSSVATVGGSGARAPNRFLDRKGDFRREAPIDLTADVESEEDEPQFVRATVGDVVPDEEKNKGPVCIGIVQAIVLCMFGCPEPIAADGLATKDPSKDDDPLWSRANWPGPSHWFLEPGYRPVMLKSKHTPSGPAQNQGSAANWGPGGNAAKVNNSKAELTVSVLLSPAAFEHQQAQQGIPPSLRKRNAHLMEPFGTLSDKFVGALEPLMARGMIQCEARCRLVERGRAGNFIHPIQILLFCMRPSVSYVSEVLAQAGITLESPQPGAFHPSDYSGHPPLVNPHASGSAGGLAPHLSRTSRPQPSHLAFGGGYPSGSRYTQSKETTEEERRKQVETVYDELGSGEDLPLTEPSNLVKTTLFPHQKQGLTFLLAREKELNFQDAAEVTSSREKTIDLTKAEDVAKDSVGLWKVVRSQVDGSIRAYRHVLTQHEQDKVPHICRGAILADDMGLGKTITVIAVIATTMQEARAFERAKPITQVAASQEKAADVAEEDSEEELLAADMAAGLQGPTSSKKSKTSPSAAHSRNEQKKKKKGGKREALREDAERIRQEHIVGKSRATLIVCPLTIVTNWEEQIKEHWDGRRPPRIYIYHGNSRSDDPKWIANHDVVLTTYATLASEFANQSIWIDPTTTADGDGDGDVPDKGDGEGFEMVDAQGASYGPDGKKKNAATKKRKRAGGREASNPLQRINWFRVVLDEAHTIKEVRTMQCRAVCNLTAQRRLSLTGTPVQNRLDDLYAQIRFLRLEPFSDRSVWNEQCGQRQKRSWLSTRANANSNNEPLEQVALVKVQTIMKFLTLRRTKDTKTASGAKLLDLPPKNTRIVTIEFDDRERAKYKDLHDRYKEDFKEMEASDSVGSNYATILQEISNLRICCDDPGLVDASKDLKRRREGRTDFTTAIAEDGITRERAVGLFEVFSEAGGADCTSCGADMTASVEDAGVIKEELSDDPSSVKTRPVVTRCLHIFCSKCFAASVPLWKRANSKGKQFSIDDLCECPACDTSLRLLLDVVQLEAADLGGAISTAPSALNSTRASPAAGADGSKGDIDFDWGSGDEAKDGKGSGNANSAQSSFGCDRAIPIEERVGLSHKVRFLLSDLVPISTCNPRSLLYDPQAPRLAHYVPTDAERTAHGGGALESVVTISLGDQTDDKTPYKPIKSIVFSQWTTMLDRIGTALYRAGIHTARLDGKMRRPDRAAALESFKKDDRCEVFLISLRAGGFGLNLVSASRAYCIEPAWNPAQEQQAMDRVHRLGQLSPVIATKVVTKDSIETKMLEIQKRKQELANKVAEKRAAGGGGTSREEERAQRREEIRTLMA